MATQTRSRSRAKKDTAPDIETSPEQPQELPDGVLVVKAVQENGDIVIDAVPVGNVQATEVLTILELAQANFRAKIGLNGQPNR